MDHRRDFLASIHDFGTFGTFGKCSKIFNTFDFLFLFSYKMKVSRTGIHKMLGKIANRGDTDQTAS